jgi:hypothetical protein
VDRSNDESDLIALICSGQAVLMAGAGTSVPRYGTWDDLLDGLERLAQVHGRDFRAEADRRANDFLSYVDDIATALNAAGEGDRYLNYLRTQFAPRDGEVDELHQLLVSLPFRGLMTTNYDPSFSAALAQASAGSFDHVRNLAGDPPGSVDDWLRSLAEGHLPPRLILHCHGYYLHPESIVLGARDYRRLYGELPPGDTDPETGFGPIRTRATRPFQILQAVVMAHPLVFVGFSMRDPAFRALVDFVMRLLWRFTADSSRTFILLPATGDNELSTSRTDELGVRVVRYEQVDACHAGLTDLLRRVHARCGSALASGSPPEAWWRAAYRLGRQLVEPS